MRDGNRSTGGPKTPVNNNGKFFKRDSNTSMNDVSEVFSSSIDEYPQFGKYKKKPKYK
jgi:hypothetical protein